MRAHEAQVKAEIAERYRSQLDAMAALHGAVVSIMAAVPWTIGKRRGLNPFVVKTLMGLLTKACKTFRSIQILCERGFEEDANPLVRVLMETTVAIIFILQKKSKERAVIYHAHILAQNLRMLNEWKATPGLKRKAPKAMLKRVNDGLAEHMTLLPAGTDVKHHWSGKRSLREAVKALRHDVMYASLYRFTSSSSHASDFGAHFQLLPTNEDFVWQIGPSARGFEVASYAARELFWMAANRIDQRLGLGFSETLGPHKLTRADIESGQR
jgi:hypothetical protein